MHEAWAIEDVWLRPVVTLALALALPWLGPHAAERVLGRVDAGDAPRALAPFEVTLAWLAGVTALGPMLVSDRDGWASHAFGALCVLAASVRRGRTDRRAFVPVVAAIGAVAIAAVVPRTEVPAWCAIAVVVAVVAALVSWRADRAPPRGVDLGVGLAVGALAVALLALPWVLTDVTTDDAPRAGGARSAWRLRVDPWDADAMLGAGWASRHRGEHARAIAQAREAHRMGLDAAPALELEAEVQAARGECDAARAIFDRALEARVARTFESDVLTAPLTLGGYRLPPALITECGGLEQLPGPGDL